MTRVCNTAAKLSPESKARMLKEYDQLPRDKYHRIRYGYMEMFLRKWNMSHTYLKKALKERTSTT